MAVRSDTRWSPRIGGDRALWFIIIVLGFMSVFVVYSSLGASVYRPSGDDRSFIGVLFGQVKMVLMGLFAVWFVHTFNYQKYMRLATTIYVLAFLATLLTYLVGESKSDATRWLTIPILNYTFQPSDFLKVATVMILARNLAKRINKEGISQQLLPPLLFWRCPERSRKILRESTYPLVLPIICSCGVVMTANLSTSLVILASCIIMLFIGRIKFGEICKFVITIAAVTVLLLGFLKMIGRAPTRLDTWIHRIEHFVGTSDASQDDADDYDYQTEQAKIAIALGGIAGSGAGQSIQRSNLPLAESDYAFAFIIEEYGAIFAGVIIFLYMSILARAITIFKKCATGIPSLLVLGLALLIVIQAVFHMMVSTNMLFPTGLTLPLISKGGSSELFTSIALGMILGISRQVTDRTVQGPKSESLTE